MRRFVAYSLLLLLTSSLSALLGEKKADHGGESDFIIPNAHADVPAVPIIPSDGTGGDSFGGFGDVGTGGGFGAPGSPGAVDVDTGPADGPMDANDLGMA